MKKKILFTLYDLSIGGIPTSFLNMVKRLDFAKYDVTVVLQRKEGVFLDALPNDVHIINYNINKFKIVLISKIINRLKLLKFILLYKNKFDFSGCYFTYCVHSSLIAKLASKNNAIWIHTDLVDYCKYNNINIYDFMEKYSILDYKNIFCVSQRTTSSLKKLFQDNADSFKLLKNIVNIDNVKKLSEVPISLKKSKITTFIFAGRFDEKEKKISYIIEACNILKKQNYAFKILLLGDGQDKDYYIDLINKYNLIENIYFILPTNNPFPYFKISDCFILTSLYEGYPVVYNEAIILKLPIITTNVSDAMIDIVTNYGLVINLDVDELVAAMKNIIQCKFKVKIGNNIEVNNNKYIKLLSKIIEEK
ncbi:MAG: glycosyltransferase [Bacilli bacterium]